jgi:hypothetical protein
MKKLLSLLCFLPTLAFAIDKPIPCEGASCKLKFETRDGSNVKVSAGEVSGSAWSIPKIVTSNGSQSIPHNTATTIFTITTAGRYEVSCYLANIGNYFSFATVAHDGTNPRIVSNNSGNSSLTLSGNNVQCTQLSGGAQTMSYTMLKIGF